MTIDRGAGALEFSEPGASLSRLPKSVRLLGKQQTHGAPELSAAMAAMYEFEVLTGNAAYRAGERFYLTAGQARRAYRIDDA